MGFLGDVGNYIFGGDATKNIDPKLKQYDAATTQLGNIAQVSPYRQAAHVQGTQLNGVPQADARAGMAGVADRLGAIASGQQAGAGELAVNRQISAATAAQVSAARMARGANAALAMRNAARNTADIGLGGAAAAAQAQMQDQQNANAQLGQVYGQMRGQDLDYAGQNAQLGQAAQLANLQAEMQQRGMNDAQQMAAIGQMLGWDQATIQAQIAAAQAKAGDKGIFPGLLQAGGSIGAAAASDERLKQNIKDGGDDADAFMDGMKPTTWRYRDEAKWGRGERLGIIAQDMARSKMGAAAIVRVDDKGHIGFDIAKATNASLAGIARLHERLKKLEGAQAA